MILPVVSPELRALRMFNGMPSDQRKHLTYLFSFIMRHEALHDYDTIAAVLDLPWERMSSTLMVAVLRSTWMYTHDQKVQESFKLARTRIHAVLVEREGDEKAERLLRNLMSDSFRTER